MSHSNQRRWTLLIVLLLLFQSSFAVIVHIDEQHRFLRVPLERIADESLPIETKRGEIAEYLSKHGYVQASVTILSDTITVVPGVRFKLDTLRVTHDRELVLHPNRYFTSALLDSLASVCTDSLRSLGYLYINFTIREMRLGDSTVTVDAEVVKGPQVRLAEARFGGLERTHPDLVKRYLSLSSDGMISSETVAQVEQDAAQIPFLTFNPPVTVQPLNGYEQADLALSFAEKRGVLLSGGLGYGGNDSRDLRWRFEGRMTNLFGDGKEASVKSERRELNRELLEIAYRQPLFLLSVDDLKVRVATRDYPNSFYEFSFGSAYTTRLRSRLQGSLALDFRSVRPATREGAYQALQTNFGLHWADLDNRLLPQSGMQFTGTVAGAWRAYQETEVQRASSLFDARLDAAFEYYRPIAHKITIALKSRYGGLETSETLPPLSELLLIGGPGSLRGWNVEQFPSIRAATFSAEPQLHFTGGYWYCFYDAGWLFNREGSAGAVRSITRYHDGFGTGVYLLSGEKALSLSLGWNRFTALNDPLVGIALTTDL